MSRKIHLPEHVFLFGHRKQRGKDVSCDICEDLLPKEAVFRNFFAKQLKLTACAKYGLDYERMEDDEYKKSIVSHIPPKEKWVCPLTGKTEKNKQFTVRDLLVLEGYYARALWTDVWSYSCFSECFEHCFENNISPKIFVISDYRFPNECSSLKEALQIWIKAKFPNEVVSYELPKIHKVLITREAMPYLSDGADDALPDEKEPHWDFELINEEVPDWHERLKKQIVEMLKETGAL